MIITQNESLFLLRDKFIQKLTLNGKKATAAILLEESLEILKSRITLEINLMKSKNRSKKNNSFIESLQQKTKLEIFEIALNKAKP